MKIPFQRFRIGNLLSNEFLLSLVFTIVERADFSGLGKYLDTIELSLSISKNIVD